MKKVAWFFVSLIWFWIIWPVVGHTEPETLITRFHPYDKTMLLVEDQFRWDDRLGYILLRDVKGTEQVLVWEEYAVGLSICTAEVLALLDETPD